MTPFHFPPMSRLITYPLFRNIIIFKRFEISLAIFASRQDPTRFPLMRRAFRALFPRGKAANTFHYSPKDDIRDTHTDTRTTRATRRYSPRTCTNGRSAEMNRSPIHICWKTMARFERLARHSYGGVDVWSRIQKFVSQHVYRYSCEGCSESFAMYLLCVKIFR